MLGKKMHRSLAAVLVFALFAVLQEHSISHHCLSVDAPHASTGTTPHSIAADCPVCDVLALPFAPGHVTTLQTVDGTVGELAVVIDVRRACGSVPCGASRGPPTV